MRFITSPTPRNTSRRRAFYGGGEQALKGDKRGGAVRALELTTGDIKWDSPYRRPGWTGGPSTATGLVFSSDDRGRFMAVDAKTGRELWHHEMTQNMRSAPLTYMIGSRQYVTIATTASCWRSPYRPATERRTQTRTGDRGAQIAGGLDGYGYPQHRPSALQVDATDRSSRCPKPRRRRG